MNRKISLTQLRRFMLAQAASRDFVSVAEVAQGYYGEAGTHVLDVVAAVRGLERLGLVERHRRRKGQKAGYALTPSGRQALPLLLDDATPRPLAGLGRLERWVLAKAVQHADAQPDATVHLSSREIRESYFADAPDSDNAYEQTSRVLRVLERRGFSLRVGRQEGIGITITRAGRDAIESYAKKLSL